MTVANGQIANAATFNNAFVSRTIDTDLVGKFDLKNADTAVSGVNIVNVQKNINALYSLLGIVPNQDHDVEVGWDDGTTTSIVEKVNDLVGSIQIPYTLANNQSVLTNITGLLLDSTKEKSAKFVFEVERVGTSEFRQLIECVAVYKGSAWAFYLNGHNEDGIVQHAGAMTSSEQIELSVTALGQFQYKSGNLAGHTSSKIKVYQIRMKV